MGKPAARLTDMHMCPMVTPGLPPIPHVGGVITGPGCATVLIGGLPAAVMGDMCVCVGPPDSIVLGSTGVLIGGKPAARMGDQCAHGGAIMAGCPTVLIGEISPGSAPVLTMAVLLPAAGTTDIPVADPDLPVTNPDTPAVVKHGNTPATNVMSAVTSNPMVLAAVKGTAAFATKLSRIDALINGAEEGAPTVHKHNEEDCKVQYQVSGKDGKPAKDMRYEIKTNDGNVHSGKTDAQGLTTQLSGYTEGMCNISFPD